MAIQSINLGAAPNDGTGDSLRVAGSKINSNFTELAASLAAGAGSGAANSAFITPQDMGVVEGVGKTAQQRIDNGTNFQAAINAATSNGNGQHKILYVPSGTYEINLPGGLGFPHYGGRWIGHKHAHIIQYATNTPIITFGQISQSSATETAAQVVDGVSVSYGNLVAATDSNSIAVVFSRVWGGDYRNFDIGSVNAVRANATLMQHGVKLTNGFFFSNNLTNFRIKHFLGTGLWFSVQGTGNNFTNIYISNGNLGQTIGTVTSCVSLNAGGSVIQENVWNQLNCEWSTAFHAVDAVNARNQVFNSLHVEGVHLRGATPYFKLNSAASMVFNGLTLLNCQPTTDEGMIYGMGWDSTVTTSIMTMENFNNTAPKIIHLVKHESGSNIRTGFVKVQQIKFHNQAFLTSADATVIDLSGANYDQTKPVKELGCVLPMTAGSTTLGDVDFRAHGTSLREIIRYNSPLTVNRTLTLTAKYDVISGMTMPNGPTHRVWRTTAATGAFTLTVSSSPNTDGSSPTVIDTLAPGQYIDVYFNGSAWSKYGEGTVT
jgi:hypothetical protein